MGRYPKPYVKSPKPKYTDIWTFTSCREYDGKLKGVFRQGKLMTSLEMEYNGDTIEVLINGHHQNNFEVEISNEQDAIDVINYISNYYNEDGKISGDLGAGVFDSIQSANQNPEASRFIREMAVF